MMKRYYLAALAAATLATAPAAVHAQAATPAGPRPGHMGRMGPMGPGRHGMHDEWMQSLNLTDAQKAQIKAIHQKYASQFKAQRDQFRAAHQADFEAARTARQRGDTAAARAAMAKVRQDMAPMRQAHEQEMNEIRAVLTPAQRQQWDAHMAQMRQRWENGKGGRARGMGWRGERTRPGTQSGTVQP